MEEYRFYPEYNAVPEYAPKVSEEGSCPTEFPDGKGSEKEKKLSSGRSMMGKISSTAAMAITSVVLAAGILNPGNAEADMELRELGMTQATAFVSSDLSLSEYEYPIYYSLYPVEEEYPTRNSSGLPLYSDIAEDPKPFDEKYKTGPVQAAGEIDTGSTTLNFSGLSSGTTYVLVLRASAAPESEIIGKELVFTTLSPNSGENGSEPDSIPPKQNPPPPSASPAPSPSPTPAATPSPTPRPSPTPSPTPVPTPSPTPYVPYVPPQPPAPPKEDKEIIAPMMVFEHAPIVSYSGASWLYLDSELNFTMDISALGIPESEFGTGITEAALNGCTVPATVSHTSSGGYVNSIEMTIAQGYHDITAPGGTSIELSAVYIYDGSLGMRCANGFYDIPISQGEKPSGSVTGGSSSFDGTYYTHGLNYHLNIPAFTDIDSLSLTPYYSGDTVLSISMPDTSGDGNFEIQSDMNFVIGTLNVTYTMHPDPIDLTRSVTGTINIPYNYTA